MNNDKDTNDDDNSDNNDHQAMNTLILKSLYINTCICFKF